MAISFANLGTSANPDINSTTNTTSYANSSWTPPTSGLIFVFVVSDHASETPNEPTISGNGLTWTSIATKVQGFARLTLFGANASGSSAGATTISFGAQTQRFCLASFGSATEIDLSSGVAAAFVQTASGGGSADNASATLSAASDADNRPIAGFYHGTHQEAVAPRTNWTELDELQGGTTPNATLETQYRSDAFETSATATWSTLAVWAGIAAELKEGAASGAATVTPGVIVVTVSTPQAVVPQPATVTPGVLSTTALVSSGSGISAGAGPATIESAVEIGQASPAVGSPETATPPGPIEAEVAMGQVTIDTATVVTPDAIAVVVTVLDATEGGGATVTPEPIAATVTTPQAALTATSTPIPAPVGVVVRLPQTGIHLTRITYTFTVGPTNDDWTFAHNAPTQDRRFWSHFGPQPRGRTVIRNNGTWVTNPYPRQSEIDAADLIEFPDRGYDRAVLLGGHETRVTQAIALELDGQGYGAFIEEGEEVVAA